MYVTETRQKQIPVTTLTVLMHEVDRAITDGEEDGFVKLHVREGGAKILGATVVASHAGALINEISLAMSAGLDLHALARVNQPYRTAAWTARGPVRTDGRTDIDMCDSKEEAGCASVRSFCGTALSLKRSGGP